MYAVEPSVSQASIPPGRFLARVVEKNRTRRWDGSVVMVAFGDSVTMGATSVGKLEPAAVYHHRLKGMLEARYPSCTFSVINSGVGGDTATASLSRIERDVLRYQPDLVLVAFGLNDASESQEKLTEFAQSLRRIIQRIREETSADVVLLTPPFMATRAGPNVDPAHRDLVPRMMRLQNEGILGQFAAAIREVAASEKTALADVYAEWESMGRSGVDTTALLANGINHPTGEAHAIIANCVLQAIVPQ